MLRFIKVLGIILTPTGAIALIAKALDVPDRETAVLSSLICILILVLIERREIDKRVHSSYLALFMIGLTTVFALSYRQVLFKETGLIRFYESTSKASSSIQDTLESSQYELWLFGTNFYKTLKDHQGILLKKLQEGTNIFVLVYDPTAKNFDTVSADFNQTPKQLRDECDICLNHIAALDKLANSGSLTGRFEVRFCQTTPRVRAYLADPADENSVSILVPHMNDIDSPHLPVYLFRNQKGGVVRTYFEGLKHLWNRSERFQDFKIRNAKYLARVTANG